MRLIPLITLALFSLAASRTDWPVYHGTDGYVIQPGREGKDDPHKSASEFTAYIENGRTLVMADASNGTQAWHFESGEYFSGEPLLHEERAFVSTNRGKVICSDLADSCRGILAGVRYHILYSLDPETGKLRWKHGIVDGAWVYGEFVAVDWSEGLQPSPVVADGILYIGGSNGFVNTLDAKTGEKIWRFETTASVSLAPTVENDKVFFSYLEGTSEHYTLDIEAAY
jgi:outer membrane protein assembly factor BamB